MRASTSARANRAPRSAHHRCPAHGTGLKIELRSQIHTRKAAFEER